MDGKIEPNPQKILYIRVGKRTKEELEKLAESYHVTLTGYIVRILENHLEMSKFIKSQQLVNPAITTINPNLMEMWRFMAMVK